MARTSSTPSTPQPAQLSVGDMRAALPKLERRLAEIESFDHSSVCDISDAAADALIDRVNDTLIEIYGHNTLDYDRYSCFSLYGGLVSFYENPSSSAIVQGYQKGQGRVSTKLKTAIGALREKLSDLETAEILGVPRSLGGVDLHPAIESAAGRLFRDGHYTNAIENACKALNALVQTKSGAYNMDNTALMRAVLNRNNPRLAFNDLQDESDLSEQEGMMHIYSGAFLAFRSPRAHRLTTDDPELAFGAIAMISFLAKLLDRTKIRNL